LYSIFWRIIKRKECIVGRTFAEVDSNNVEQSYGDFRVFFDDWKEHNIGYTVVRTELIGSYAGLRNDLSAVDELTWSAFQRILKQLAVWDAAGKLNLRLECVVYVQQGGVVTPAPLNGRRRTATQQQQAEL
jgi:hypothetical protein